MKELLEKKNSLLDELDIILNKAQSEKRAFNDEELKKVAEIKEEVRKIEETVKLQDEVRGLEKTAIKNPEILTKEEARALEIRKEEEAFISYLRESRAAMPGGLQAGNNGVVIPTTIANQIIDTVKNMSPILQKVKIWSVSGNLTIPVYDFTQHIVGFVSEGQTLSASGSNFTSKQLTNHIVGTLALISRSMITRADIDVVPYVVSKIGQAIGWFLENELINNTNSTFSGTLANGVTQTLNGATTLVITAQELLNLQMKVPQVYQPNCAWLMHPNTLSYIQGLTAGAGNNLLLMGNSLSEYGPHTLLGKDVYLSDNMPQIGVNAREIYYGDFSGLHVKLAKGVEIQVLQEKYADSYSYGVTGYCEVDANLPEVQKLAVYVGK